MKIDALTSSSSIWQKKRAAPQHADFAEHLQAAQNAQPNGSPSQKVGQDSLQDNINYLLQDIQGSKALAGRELLSEHRRQINERSTRLRDYMQTHFPDDPDAWRKVPDDLEYFPPNMSDAMKKMVLEYKHHPDYTAEEYQQFYWIATEHLTGMHDLSQRIDMADMMPHEVLPAFNVQQVLAQFRATAAQGEGGRVDPELFPGDPSKHYTQARMLAFLDKAAAAL